MMDWVIVGAVILIGLFLSGFFSGAETGLYCVNRLRLHLGARLHDPRAVRLAGTLDDEHGALSVTLVGTNMANYVTTSAAAYLLAETMDLTATGAELYTIVILTPVVFVFGEVVPKNLFRLHPDTLMARGSRLLAVSNRLLRSTGAIWCLKKWAAVLGRITGGYTEGDTAFAPKQRVARMLQEALAGNTLGEDQSDLIDRVCRLSETRLFTVMVPRNRVIAIVADASRDTLIRVARRKRFARLPVYESNPRRIIGVVRVDELLQSEDWQTVSDRLHPTLTLSPHEAVATAITRLQRAKRGMAVVTDRGGQMLGIVTLKDLISEVVGGLPDGI
jgi:CBS domain containing-hemolysin-like protein